MTTVKDIYDYLDEIAPFRYQESYDNAGILIGREEMEVTGVLISLDSTAEVIEDAVGQNCNVVVCHHPIIFSGVKRIDYRHYISKTLISAIKNDVAVIAIHTNLDNVLNKGVNQMIASRIGVVDLEILNPNYQLDETGQVGSGVIGNLNRPTPALDYLSTVKKEMKAGVIKYTELVHDQVQRIAICGGSGSFLLPAAIASGADLFITSDYKYHEYFEANSQIIIADIGHYESEQYTSEQLNQLISQKFSNFAVRLTKVNTNPVNYL